MLVVTIKSTKYLCDVGFGGSNSIAPVLLGHNGDPQLLPEGQFRTTSQANGYTMLERQLDGQWDALYMFREDEAALPCDIEVRNFPGNGVLVGWITSVCMRVCVCVLVCVFVCMYKCVCVFTHVY